MKYRIVIPARYASTRLPGKALRLCAGKPLLQMVFEQAQKSSAELVVIATDDRRIEETAGKFGATVVMTHSDHASGSDRIAEAVKKLDWPDDCLLVNLQGDEPLMPPECLDQVADLLHQRQDASVATLWWPIASAEEFANPNAVKVVSDHSGQALYFSRTPIPGTPRERSVTGTPKERSVTGTPKERSVSGTPKERSVSGSQQDQASGWEIACRHIGLYAYKAGILHQLTRLPRGKLEIEEHLEQLRWLEAGHRIVIARADRPVPAGVDTEADLLMLESILAKRQV